MSKRRKTCSCRCPLSYVSPEYHASDYYISCPFRHSVKWYGGMKPVKDCVDSGFGITNSTKLQKETV